MEFQKEPQAPQPQPENEQTFINLVLKIIGPQIIADFIKQTWASLSDKKREELSKVVSDSMVKAITPDNWTVRTTVESEVRDTVHKIAEELTVVYYPEILARTHEVYKARIKPDVEAACNEAIKKTLKVINDKLELELRNVIYKDR